ncbi:hypothetical protein F4803DRAFT_527163, partial [Xylaria telfairii]
MFPQLPATSRRPSRTPTWTKVKSTSASTSGRADGASTQILDVDEMPPPMPSSWRPCSGSGEPMAAGRTSIHSSVEGGRSEARSTRPFEVPLRTKRAGSLRWPFSAGVVDVLMPFDGGARALGMAQPLRVDCLLVGPRRSRCFILAAVVVWTPVLWTVVTWRGLVDADADRRIRRRPGWRCGVEGGIDYMDLSRLEMFTNLAIRSDC